MPRARKKKERKVLDRRGTKVIERQSAAAGRILLWKKLQQIGDWIIGHN